MRLVPGQGVVMRNDTPRIPVREIQANAMPITAAEDFADMVAANIEISQSLFCDRDRANELLFEINRALRLRRIARSRDRACLGKEGAEGYPRLVCVDGKPVNSPDELSTLDQTYLAVLVTLHACIGQYALAFLEP
jgi:hypothetical protein